MGNYLTALRVPAPDEDERNDPLYYDWTVPKWSPFKEATSTADVSWVGPLGGSTISMADSRLVLKATKCNESLTLSVQEVDLLATRSDPGLPTQLSASAPTANRHQDHSSTTRNKQTHSPASSVDLRKDSPAAAHYSTLTTTRAAEETTLKDRQQPTASVDAASKSDASRSMKQASSVHTAKKAIG